MKSGDEVCCIRGNMSLVLGKRYVIRGFCINGFKPELVSLVGLNGWFSQASFCKLPKEIP